MNSVDLDKNARKMWNYFKNQFMKMHEKAIEPIHIQQIEIEAVYKHSLLIKAPSVWCSSGD